MILGISPEESIKLYGHDNATYHKEHVQVLRSLGYDVNDKFTKVDNRKRYTLPDVCLVRVSRAGRNTGHMIVHYKGRFYDPSPLKNTSGVYNSKEELFATYPAKWRIEYYLEVKRRIKPARVESQDDNLQAVAGEKRYNVRVSHDIHNKGYLQYINRIMTEQELERIKQSEKFKLEFAVEMRA